MFHGREANLTIVSRSLTCAALLVVAQSAAQSQPCPCPTQDVNPAERVAWTLRTSTAVFSGMVLEISPAPIYLGHAIGETVALKLQVRTTWSGHARAPEGIVVVVAPRRPCGFVYDVGRSYLVFATSYGGELVSGSCAMSKPLEAAADDMRLLSVLTDPARIDAVLEGSTVRELLEMKPTVALMGRVVDAEGIPLQGATVHLTGDQLLGGNRATISDEKGRFRFPALPRGACVLTVNLLGYLKAEPLPVTLRTETPALNIALCKDQLPP